MDGIYIPDQREAARVGQMEAKDRVTILLKEYDTLRAEMLSRASSRFGMIGIAIAFSGFWFSKEDRSRLVALIVYTGIGGLWIWFSFLMRQLNRGLRRIEQDVNTLAGDPPLLQWESRGRSPIAAAVDNKLTVLAERFLGWWRRSRHRKTHVSDPARESTHDTGPRKPE